MNDTQAARELVAAARELTARRMDKDEFLKKFGGAGSIVLVENPNYSPRRHPSQSPEPEFLEAEVDGDFDEKHGETIVGFKRLDGGRPFWNYLDTVKKSIRRVRAARELTGAGFTKGFPEMSDADWKALEKGNERRHKQFQKENAVLRKEIQDGWDEEDREWQEKERKQREQARARNRARTRGEIR